MDANKKVPAGSVRVYGVITLKEAGDFAKIKDKFQTVIENSHK